MMVAYQIGLGNTSSKVYYYNPILLMTPGISLDPGWQTETLPRTSTKSGTAGLSSGVYYNAAAPGRVYTVNPKLSFWGDLPRYPVKNKTVLKHSIFWELAPLSAEDNPVSGFGTCLHLVTLYHRIF